MLKSLWGFHQGGGGGGGDVDVTVGVPPGKVGMDLHVSHLAQMPYH